MLISQARNNILKVFQSLKLTTYNVLVTGDIGPYNEQWVILHPPGLHKKTTFYKCLYLGLETTFLRSSKN